MLYNTTAKKACEVKSRFLGEQGEILQASEVEKDFQWKVHPTTHKWDT